MAGALDPLKRLLMVAEYLDSAATWQDRPGAMAELESNAAVLREVHAEVRDELHLRSQIMREQGAELRNAEHEAYEAWCAREGLR